MTEHKKNPASTSDENNPSVQSQGNDVSKKEKTDAKHSVEIPADEHNNDPFARLKRKKVTVPKPLTSNPSPGTVSWQVKQWKKISPKVFLIGCVAFLLVFLVLVFFGLFFIAQSNEFLQGIGLEVDDVKNILLIFAAMFFWIIFFTWFYILVLNVYRVVTVKTQKKTKFILWIVIWFFVILFTIVTWTLSINQINQLGWERVIRTNLLLVPLLQTRDWEVNIWDSALTNPYPLIAPLRMRYQLNRQFFDRYIAPQIGNANIIWFSMQCGNGQTLTAPATIYAQWQGGFFDGHCLYMTKWNYDLTMQVEFQRRTSNTTETRSFDVTTMNVWSEIQLIPEWWDWELNDTKDEFIVWVAPMLVNIRAPLLFSDLWLRNNSIEWDLNDDNQVDITNNANFLYPFSAPKLHTINYRLPEHPYYSDVWFSFDMRVIESWLPQCTLLTESIDWERRYRFTPRFSQIADVAQFSYTIYDRNQDTFVERNRRESRDEFIYTFPWWGLYEVQVSYFTRSWERWSCAPELMQIWHLWNRVSFNTRFRQDTSTAFVAASDTTPVSIDMVNNEMIVSVIPAIIELEITDIQPDPNSQVSVFFDGRQVFPERERFYEFSTTTLWRKELKFLITSSTGREEEQIFDVNVTRASVRAQMIVTPQVGEDPLEVSLDASISPLYDEEDEIVYFTWDFGDGTTRANLSAWKVTHTYTYNEERESWEYFPRVTVQTRKWYTDTYRLETPILVTRRQRTVDITVDSHPTRQVRNWDIVTFSVETDGLIESINWDFGPMWTVWCQWRQCATTPVRYTQSWDFEVRVEVIYANDVPVTSRTRIRVFD